MKVRSASRATRLWAKQTVNIQDPSPKSAAALVLLTKKYIALDKTIYSDARMAVVRKRWMKEQMKTPDSLGGLTCAICGKKGLNPNTKSRKTLATLDHIIELKDGGSWRDPSNFRIACYRCNCHRNDAQQRPRQKST